MERRFEPGRVLLEVPLCDMLGWIVVSAFVQDGVRRMAERAIEPRYDGSYMNDETGHWHDTWLIDSECGQKMYVLDRSRVTGHMHCTCPAANDYSKPCKHREYFWTRVV